MQDVLAERWLRQHALERWGSMTYVVTDNGPTYVGRRSSRRLWASIGLALAVSAVAAGLALLLSTDGADQSGRLQAALRAHGATLSGVGGPELFRRAMCRRDAQDGGRYDCWSAPRPAVVRPFTWTDNSPRKVLPIQGFDAAASRNPDPIARALNDDATNHGEPSGYRCEPSSRLGRDGIAEGTTATGFRCVVTTQAGLAVLIRYVEFDSRARLARDYLVPAS